MHVISLGMIVPAIRILAILSPGSATMASLPPYAHVDSLHPQREQISRPTVLFEVALSKLAQPQTYRVKLCSEGNVANMYATRTHPHVSALVPAIIGEEGLRSKGRGLRAFQKNGPVCTIVTRLDAPTWKRKSSVSIFLVACLSWNDTTYREKGSCSPLRSREKNRCTTRHRGCMRDNDRKLVALTRARFFCDRWGK